MPLIISEKITEVIRGNQTFLDGMSEIFHMTDYNNLKIFYCMACKIIIMLTKR